MDVHMLKTALQKVSSESEKEFALLSDSFSAVLTAITVSAHSFTQIREQLSDAVQAQNALQMNNQLHLNDFLQRNRDLFKNVAQNLTFLKKMNEFIVKIKNESIEMEIVSLIAQSDQLIAHEKNVQQAFTALKNSIKKGEILFRHAGELKKSVGEQIVHTVDEALHQIQPIIQLAKSVSQPIMSAMECMQMHDIIRQSIDDVRFTIGHIGELPRESTTEILLDHCCCNEKLAELSQRLLTAIIEKILTCVAIFSKNHAEIGAILSTVEKHEANLQKKCAAVSEEMSESMNRILAYHNTQTQVMSQFQVIQTHARKMQTCFTDFFYTIDNVRSVAVAPHIKIAQNETKSSIHSSIDHMAKLIVQTNENVHRAQEHLQLFIDNSSHDILHLTTEKNTIVASFKQLIGECVEKMHHFSVFTPDFFENYEKITAGISKIAVFEHDLRSVQDSLHTIIALWHAKKVQLLQQSGLSGWNGKNDRFNEIIRHFTFVPNKQTAGDMGGFHIEDGKKSGEITFFREFIKSDQAL